MRYPITLAALVSALILAACGGGGGVGPVDSEVTPLLRITTEPTDSSHQAPLTVVAQYEDAQGNVLPLEVPMQIDVLADPRNPVCTGTRQAVPAAGIATFDTLYLDASGTFRLVVTSTAGGGLEAETATFAYDGPPATLTFAAVPDGEVASVHAPIDVHALDKNGNPTSAEGVEITVELSANPGALLFLASGQAMNPRSTYNIVEATEATEQFMWEDQQPAVFRGMDTDPTTGLVFASTGADLYTIDPKTGDTTLVGSHGIAGLRGLAVVDGDLIMGHGASPTLYDVDPVTGVAAEIGVLPSRNRGCFALDTDPTTGVLYGVLATDSVFLRSLWMIDLADPTGASIHITFMHRKPNPSTWVNLQNVSGMGFLPDGSLHVVGDETGSRPSDHNTIWTVDPATAQCTALLSLSTVEEGESMAVVPASLFGTACQSTRTGTATFSDLRFEAAGDGYRLRASAPGLDPAESTPFDILPR